MKRLIPVLATLEYTTTADEGHASREISMRHSTTCYFVLGFAALLFARAGNACADDSQWKAGLASAKITPSEPVRMSGYASRTQPSQGVALDLYAKALALEDRQGNHAVLITSDVIGFRADFAEQVCGRISQKTGLRREQILLNSSHTHTGPALGLDEKSLDFPSEQAKATVRYSRWLQDRLVELAANSLGQFKPARLSWSTGVATFVMNRREFTDRGIRLGVNPRGLADRSVPVLRIDSPDGELRCVLFGAACHNTTLTGKHLQISGDFAGYAQVQIERAHRGAQAMFMQGCAGDANPFPRGSEEIARLHGRALGDEVLRVLKADLKPVQGPLRTVLRRVQLPLAPAPSKEQIEAMARERGGWRKFVATKMREELDTGGKLASTYTSPIAVWQLGGDLTLVALPGEVVVDYVSMLESALGPQRLWIAAYSNDVFGYLPSAKVLDEGGYETRGLYAGGVGFFSPKAEGVVVKAVSELARQAGRPEAER